VGVRPALKIDETNVVNKVTEGIYTIENDDIDTYGKTKNSKSVKKESNVKDVILKELNSGDIIIFHGEKWKLINPSTGLLLKEIWIEDLKFDNTSTY